MASAFGRNKQMTDWNADRYHEISGPQQALRPGGRRVGTVCVRHHLVHLPSSDRADFVYEPTREAAADEPPLTLDYWRLDIDARRPAA